MQPLAWLLPASVLLAAQTCEPPTPKKETSEKTEKSDSKTKKSAETDEKKDDENVEADEGDSEADAPPIKELEVPIEIEGLPGQLAQVPGTNIVLTTPYGVDITKKGIKLNEGKNFWLTFSQADTGLHVVFQNDGPLACNPSASRTYSASQIAFMRKSCETMREVAPENPE